MPKNTSVTDVKEMLKEGKTKEELMKILENEINSAKEEIAAEAAKQKEEKEAEKKLDDARAAMLTSLIPYVKALGLIEDNEISTSDYNYLINILKAMEKSSIFITAFDTYKKDTSKDKNSGGGDTSANSANNNKKNTSKIFQDLFDAYTLAFLSKDNYMNDIDRIINEFLDTL